MLREFSSLLHHKYLDSIRQIERLSNHEIRVKTQRIKDSLIGIKIHLGKEDEKGENYPYSQFEVTADIPFRASLFEDAADLIIHSNPKLFKNVDIILSEGDRGGGPLSQAVGRKTGPRVSLANWHKNIPEGLPDTIIVKTQIGFSGEGSIVVSGIKSGQRVVLVDELLSTGGTAEAMIKAVEEAGGIVVGAFFIGEKVDQNGRNRLTKQFPNLKITTLVRFNARIEYGYTTDAEQDRVIELIGSSTPFDPIDAIHEVDNIKNSIYENVIRNILKNFKRKIMSKISHRELEKIRNKAREEMDRIIMGIKEEYKRRKELEQERLINERAKAIFEGIKQRQERN